MSNESVETFLGTILPKQMGDLKNCATYCSDVRSYVEGVYDQAPNKGSVNNDTHDYLLKSLKHTADHILAVSTSFVNTMMQCSDQLDSINTNVTQAHLRLNLAQTIVPPAVPFEPRKRPTLKRRRKVYKLVGDRENPDARPLPEFEHFGTHLDIDAMRSVMSGNGDTFPSHTRGSTSQALDSNPTFGFDATRVRAPTTGKFEPVPQLSSFPGPPQQQSRPSPPSSSKAPPGPIISSVPTPPPRLSQSGAGAPPPPVAPSPSRAGPPAPPSAPVRSSPPAPPAPVRSGPPAPPAPVRSAPPAPPAPARSGPPAPPAPARSGPPAPPAPARSGPPAPPAPSRGAPPPPPAPRAAPAAPPAAPRAAPGAPPPPAPRAAPSAPPPPAAKAAPKFGMGSAKGGGGGGRGDLLAAIRKGKGLKKAVTVDKSGPAVGNKPSAPSRGGGPQDFRAALAAKLGGM